MQYLAPIKYNNLIWIPHVSFFKYSSSPLSGSNNNKTMYELWIRSQVFSYICTPFGTQFFHSWAMTDLLVQAVHKPCLVLLAKQKNLSTNLETAAKGNF